MKRKSEVSDQFIKFVAFVKNTTGKKIKILRTDGGKEYDNMHLNNYLATLGIVHQKTNPHTPQQNGVAERSNRTLIESVRSSIHMRSNRYTNIFKKANNATLELWGEFLKSAVYILNRTLSTSNASNTSSKTPFELLFNQKPNLENLRVVGCRAYVHIPECNRKKLDTKAIPCWLVGYGEETKGWRLWDPVSRKIILSRDVVFDENLLISDFNVSPTTETENKSEYVPFDPFLLSTEILNLVKNFFNNMYTTMCVNIFFSLAITHQNPGPLHEQDNTESDVEEHLDIQPIPTVMETSEEQQAQDTHDDNLHGDELPLNSHEQTPNMENENSNNNADLPTSSEEYHAQNDDEATNGVQEVKTTAPKQ